MSTTRDHDQRSVEPQVGRLAELLPRLLDVDEIRTVIELGARDCNESVALARALPGAHVFAFECNPATLPACREAVRDVGDVTLVESAVSDRDGPVAFYAIDQEKTRTTWADGNPGASSLLRASGNYPVENYVQQELTVPSVRLDTFMASHPGRTIDLLWMDIQGAEVSALLGAGELLGSVKVIHTEVEFLDVYAGQPLFWDVWRFLRRRGFVLAGFTELGTYASDAVFVKWSALRPARRLVAIPQELRLLRWTRRYGSMTAR